MIFNRKYKKQDFAVNFFGFYWRLAVSDCEAPSFQNLSEKNKNC